jgi:tetratricopeptide (TPR) repeat protein
MSGIFISYRREDSQALAGRLFDRLTRRFGNDRVFRDIDAIDPGAKFAEVIGERIGGCDALVALIGKGWLEAKDAEGRRRLDLPGDFVKAEIAAALAQGKLVIPALIEGTTMPAREALPAEIAALAERNALPISDSRFDFDIGRLISVIDKALAPERSAITSPSAPRRTGFLAWLSGTRMQRTLAFLGAGIAAVGAAWTAYVHFSEKPTPPAVSATQGGIAAGGNVTATAAQGGVAVVATGPVTIGITLAEYEERIKKRERQLREEFARTSRTDKDRIALLEKQLDAADALARSPEQGLEKYKELLADASRSLQQLEPRVPAEELERARQALARGDTAEAERLFQKLLGQDKVRAAEAAYQLGKLAESRIDYATAAKYFGEAVKLQPDNPQYLNAAGETAYTLARYGDAEPLFEQSLAIRKKALGPEHPDVAASLNHLALLYDAQGLYAKAEPLYQQSLAIRKKALGPEHPDVAQSLNNLALLYEAQGLYAKAEPLYQQSLAIWRKAFGPEHPEVATGLNNLAGLYDAQGLYAKAEPLYQQSLAIRKKALGLEHPDVAQSLNNLAELYRSQDLYAKAEPLYQQSLAIWKKALGSEHRSVATSLNNLALLYRAQGLYAKAEPLFQRSLAIRKKALGPEHREVAQSLNNLALLYDAQGFYAKAEPLYQQSLAIWKKALGREHPDVATGLENYATLLTHLKRDKEAADLRAQAKAIRARLANKS